MTISTMSLTRSRSRLCVFTLAILAFLIGGLTTNQKTTVLRVKVTDASSSLPGTRSVLRCDEQQHLKSRNSHSYKGHMTFLGPNSPPPCMSMFPYRYIPAPGLDQREIYFGNTEISEMFDLSKFILKEKPSWGRNTSTDIGQLLSSHRQETSTAVWNKTIKLLSFIDSVQGNGKEPKRSLYEIVFHLSLLAQKKFPTQRRQLTCNGCFPYDYKNVISPKDSCKQGDNIDIVIIITTIPKNANKRMAVRKTWGSDNLKKKYKYKVIFLFGSGWPEDQIGLLKKENIEHNDILMDDFIDHYYNLTQKVLMGFRWVLRECPKTQFVIRAADDTSVNIIEVFSLIHKYGNDEALQKYQFGRCLNGGHTPRIPYFRIPYFRHYLSTLEYDRNRFPPFAAGTVFVTSVNLTQELVDISPNIPYLALEDAYFGLALEQLGRGCHDIEKWYGQYISHGSFANIK